MIDVPSILAGLGPVFSTQDAARAGLSAKVLRRAIAGDLVRRVAPGWLVARDVWEASSDRDRHLLLAHVASRQRPWAVVSHHSAASHHELPVPPTLPPWVAMTTDHAVATACGGIARLEPAALPPHCVIDVDGERYTTVTRTVIDCFRSLPLSDAVAMADHAVRHHQTTLPALQLERGAQRGWPMIGQADCGLWLLDASRESWFESSSFVNLWLAGIPVPEHQVSVYDEADRFIGRVDGIWRKDNTVGEADGEGKYLGELDPEGPSAAAAARKVVAERRREERLQGLGLEVARWAPTDSFADRETAVRRARARGRASHFRGRLVSSPLSRHEWREHVDEPPRLGQRRLDRRRRLARPT